MTKLLFLSGSTRKDSFNKKLAILGSKIALGRGVDAEFIDLLDFPMPIYNGDDESASGLPENAIKLKQLFIECDGFFMASPEYNSSISALLKNTIDWLSRAHEKDETPLIAFSGKVAAISSASPGGLGGLRGLSPLRSILCNIGVHVVPNQLAVSAAFDQFDAQGELTDPKVKSIFDGVIEQLVSSTIKLAAG